MSFVKIAIVAASLYATANNLFAQARDTYPNALPSGSRVVVVQGKSLTAIGHAHLEENPVFNTIPNAFGGDFSDALSSHGLANLWVNELCAKDSDNDGVSNGEELCDANCDGVTDAGCTLTHPALVGDSLDFAEDSIDLFKLHAALMIIAWIILAPFGILLVIIRKRKPGWFPYHKNIMSTVTVVTLIGFIVIVKQLGFDQLGKNQHTKAGLVTVLLALVQPVSGFLRVHVHEGVKSTKRLAWEFQHQWTGRLCMFTATLATITGIEAYFGNEDFGYFLAAVFALVTLLSFAYVFCIRDKEKYAGNLKRPMLGKKPQNLKVKSDSYSSTPPPSEPVVAKSVKSRTFADFEV